MSIKATLYKRICLCAIILLMVGSLTEAATGTARVFYNSSLSVGMSAEIKDFLTQYGYMSTLVADPKKLTVRAALHLNNKVVFFHTHGSTTPLLVCSNGNLYPSDITYSNNSLTYLSTCYSAYPPNSTSSFRGRMASLGVPMTVGFRSTISAVGSSDGIHYFNWDTFRRLKSGYQLGHAIEVAKSRTYNTFGGYYGCNSVEYGHPLEELP